MRYAMAFEYDGQPFCGWQTQAHAPSVQEEVEAALSKVADSSIRVVCSGRTDSGVHALQQVVHFDTDVSRSSRSWVLGCNVNLPDAISAQWAREVDSDFSARFSAVSRTYRYTIINRWTRPALARHRQTWVRYPLDHELMQQAAEHLLGEHDFTSFRAVHCQAHHPVRTISAIKVRRKDRLIEIDITANAFLYHMVRNIAGSLIPVGRGQQEPEWIAEVLQSKSRAAAGKTAAPEGLIYIGPRYASAQGFPELPLAAFPEHMLALK
ncbi:MAG: tRNA pseudouridine(38-40) synthase TruA [Xanthomonadales bacterium]|nr:tRNA pseudouridine(38-40) synthase TruA [Xanthomonadales bacterium]